VVRDLRKICVQEMADRCLSKICALSKVCAVSGGLL
jgi:hypothetical protein